MADGDRHIFRASADGGLPYCGSSAWNQINADDTGKVCESCLQIDAKESAPPKTVKRKKGKTKG